MARLEFSDLSFSETGENIKVNFLKLYYFEIPKKDLGKIGDFHIEKNAITFKNISEKKAQNKFSMVLTAGFSNLKFIISGNKAVYIHQNSGIPLIGSNSFGLVDRDTNLIEIKPITGCNLNCNFCSVDEGKDTKKITDFIVEKDYLVNEFRKLASFKSCKPLYAYINVHGEPTLYAPIAELIKDLKKIPNVIAGIITNGTLLNEDMIDDFKKAGLDRINISLNAYSKDTANKLAGTAYNLEKVLKMIKYAAKKLEVVVAPLYLEGMNDRDIDKIIDFVLGIRKNNFPIIGIQNFLEYKLGRNPVKQIPWPKFRQRMEEWEKKHNTKLEEDNFYEIFKTKQLLKPFRKGEIVTAEIICEDRYPRQRIAKANERIISILNCSQKSGKVKARIIRDKHNIFVASLI